MSAVLRYIDESLQELRHVRWPTRQQAYKLSFIVLGFTAVSAVVFGFVDFLLAAIVKFILPS